MEKDILHWTNSLIGLSDGPDLS